MSNSILYDPLLVRYLADELDRELRGRACAAAPIFSPGMNATLPLEGGRALRLDLHPTRGWVRLIPWDEEGEELDAICVGVDAPADERILVIRLRTADRFRVGARSLVVELQTNQWNAILVNEEDDRVLTLLRGRSAAGRVLQPGHPYRRPDPRWRFGLGDISREAARERWVEVLGPLAPGDRRGGLLSGFAFTGTPSAAPILGTAGEEDGAAALEAAFDRWWQIRSLPAAEPVLARIGSRRLPAPLPLPGLEVERVPSLLEAMESLAEGSEAEPDRDQERALLLRRVERRIAAADRRVARLQDELGRAGEVDRLRSFGDLLLANKRLVPHGADRVRLMGWDRKIVEIELDPAIGAAENAARWYAEARRRARAEERLPAMLQEAQEEMARWTEARGRLQRGEEMPGWAERELERSGPVRDPGGASEQEQGRPYRSYRTAGGLEVRVGRNARDNDRLTFGNSSPNDVWLHARSVAGSHVILRWTDEASPPARDLEEAATLAALFSKARTSALVPVDWTRRKHVRKPRGAPAGAVIPQRVKTLFVTPDADAEERLRD